MASSHIRKAFGQYVRDLRERQGFGLREVSRRVGRQQGSRGLSPAYLSLIERGYVEIPQKHILRHLAAVLGVDEDHFASVALGERVVRISEIFQDSPHHRPILSALQSGTASHVNILSAILDMMKPT